MPTYVSKEHNFFNSILTSIQIKKKMKFYIINLIERGIVKESHAYIKRTLNSSLLAETIRHREQSLTSNSEVRGVKREIQIKLPAIQAFYHR